MLIGHALGLNPSIQALADSGSGADHNLLPVGVTANPNVGNPTLGQTHSLSLSGISAAPSVGIPSLSLTTSLSPSGISVAPSVGSPSLGQLHELVPAGVSTAPSVGTPTLDANAQITFTVGDYTRGSDGSNPTLTNTDVVATSTTGPYFMDLLSVTNGTTPSQADMDAGSGTGVIEKITLGPEADIEDLDGPLDLNSSIANGRIYVQYRDSSGTPVKSALTSVPTADSITYDAVAPTFSSAEIGNIDADTLRVTFSKAVYDVGDTLSASDFSLTGNTISAVAHTDGNTYVDLTLGTTATSSDDYTGDLDYTGTDLTGIDGESVATFADEDVTNNLSATFSVTELPLAVDTVAAASLSTTIAALGYGSGDKIYAFVGPEQFISGTATLGGEDMDSEVATTGNFGGRLTLLSITLTGDATDSEVLASTLAASTNSKAVRPFAVVGGSLTGFAVDQSNTASSLSAAVTPNKAENVILGVSMGLDDTYVSGVSWTGATKITDAQPVAFDSGESYARIDGASLSLQTLTMTSAAASPQDAGLIVALFEAD